MVEIVQVNDAGQVSACFLVPDNDDLDFRDEDIALSAWVLPAALNDVHFILSKGDQYRNPKTTNYALRISASRHLEFLIRDSQNQARTAASRFTIPLNEWTFLAAFYDYSAGRVYMWDRADAAAVDTLDFRQSFFPNEDPLCIGAWFSSDPSAPTAKGFKGGVDDVRISGRLEDVLPLPSAVDFREAPDRTKGTLAIRAFPNPMVVSETGEEIGIAVDRGIDAGASVFLYDILGRQIRRADLPRIDPGLIFRFRVSGAGSPLTAGLYILRIVNGRDNAIQKVYMVR